MAELRTTQLEASLWFPPINSTPSYKNKLKEGENAIDLIGDKNNYLQQYTVYVTLKKYPKNSIYILKDEMKISLHLENVHCHHCKICQVGQSGANFYVI